MADDMFRPPINRSMLQLDRAFFQRTIPLKAARVLDNKSLANVRTQLERSKDVLTQTRIMNVQPTPHGQPGDKCILLRPDRHDGVGGDLDPHSPVLKELVDQSLVQLIDYDLTLHYDYWTYHDIISAILPEQALDEIPSGFTQTGHVLHLNLREDYLKYRYLIAEILIDKQPGVTTIINKINDVGGDSVYRTFQYEVLAGKDDLNVSIIHENCVFEFDFSKVYWNTRLSSEHHRMVEQFREGEAVCDVMAGIGPFAVPAGKRGVFVWANDLNPDSSASLEKAITRNKVQDFVKPFNEDGFQFIRRVTEALLHDDHSVNVFGKAPRGSKAPIVKTLHQPKTFQHFVMNLPASALTFLPAFIGLYAGELRGLLPPGTKMPIVHVYCFNTKSDDNAKESIKICDEISNLLRYPMKPGKIEDGDVEINDVRDVAPKKRMFCASFRLPEDVAFREDRGEDLPHTLLASDAAN